MEINKDLLPAIQKSDLPKIDLTDTNIYYCRAYQDGNAHLTKEGTYGGIDFQWGYFEYNAGNLFSISNGKIYYNGTKRAVIHVDIELSIGINQELSPYLLFLGVNGGYSGLASFSAQSIAGSSSAVSGIQFISPGDYITCSIGALSSFEHVSQYTSQISVLLLGFLD